MERLLAGKGHEIFQAEDGDAALEVLKKETLDLVISDVDMQPVNGLELLKKSRELYVDLQVVMLTNASSTEVAVESMTKGAFDYITKPVKVDDLFLTVQHALEYCATVAENKRLKAEMEKLNPFEDIVAQSNSMLQIANTISQVSLTDSSVLLCGEDGTSKEQIARTIHRSSRRKTGPFLAVNCEGLSSHQLALDLFGYVKDAFPRAQDGALETMNGGTLFLDEITAMPIDLQTQCLEVMRTGKISKTGGARPVEVDVRFIVASSKDLQLLVDKKVFRKDFYQEVSTVRIDISPLRDRQEDILPLVDQVLRKKTDLQSRTWDVDAVAEKTLRNYTWPCNERELEGAIGYARSVARKGAITNADLPFQIVTAVEKMIHSDMEHDGQLKGYFFRIFMRNKDKQRMKQADGESEENDQENPDEDAVNWMG